MEAFQRSIMEEKITEKIKIWGIVQGVGFRPYLSKLAQRYELDGDVANVGGMVELRITATAGTITAFLETMEREKPEPAEIVHIHREPMAERSFSGFSIRKSQGKEETGQAPMIPPDLALCDHCLEELHDPHNPRYQHPFISCMVCGPRYTIIKKLPYDRETTTMDSFPMCGFCHGEYTDVQDRRYHAQTISCHHCGPMVKDTRDSGDHQSPWLEQAVAHIRAGKIIAIKGMGGYRLFVDPYHEEGVSRLRKVKNRYQKPFAVMFPSLKEVEAFCHVSPGERKLLTSGARPIVLLEKKDSEKLALGGSAAFPPGHIGAFLPGMGLEYLLLEKIGGPLIATSANDPGIPIITEEAAMEEFMGHHREVERIFFNTREILTGVDDSVVRLIDDNPQMIRRSKGYTPIPIHLNKETPSVWALGSHLKGSFTLSKGSFAYPGPLIGDLDTEESRVHYRQTLEHLSDLFEIRPQKVICDYHPDYFTTNLGRQYSKKYGVPLIQVQHHHSHIASVMAEHHLEEPVIGVSFDGTGYGIDGAVWGGELLLCHQGTMERKKHLAYTKMVGGDPSMKQAWKSATAYVCRDRRDGDFRKGDEFTLDLRPYLDYSREEKTLEGWQREMDMVSKALNQNINTYFSSSMGRLFDGIAALLGLGGYNYFEGQCAMALENAATLGKAFPGKNKQQDLAYRFHRQVVQSIVDGCLEIRETEPISRVALSGGVFQNKILMEETLSQLRYHGFEVFYNQWVSPNDGGISLGQLYLAQHREK